MKEKQIAEIYKLLWISLDQKISKFDLEKSFMNFLYKKMDKQIERNREFDFFLMDLWRLWDYKSWNEIKNQTYECLIYVKWSLKRQKVLRNC